MLRLCTIHADAFCTYSCSATSVRHTRHSMTADPHALCWQVHIKALQAAWNDIPAAIGTGLEALSHTNCPAGQCALRYPHDEPQTSSPASQGQSTPSQAVQRHSASHQPTATRQKATLRVYSLYKSCVSDCSPSACFTGKFMSGAVRCSQTTALQCTAMSVIGTECRTLVAS
jgi:hypothetical protein